MAPFGYKRFQPSGCFLGGKYQYLVDDNESSPCFLVCAFAVQKVWLQMETTEGESLPLGAGERESGLNCIRILGRRILPLQCFLRIVAPQTTEISHANT